ncbi:glutaredoxin family protein [Rhodococcus zopfii]|uniref:Glutaredoxin family protein n=1 Tax=Rhodococcus zopfii TaxID=43772 RepID=A0ABU3WMF4_9NOCA|nr:glutaredoxin family protein [Rhodococcus zopfii]MDV2477225.1 glutaredoxin family protein [Rhodococcus zopfii]
MTVTLYAKSSGCQGCKLTARHLERQGTPFVELFVDQDPAAAQTVALLGYRSVPVVTAGDMHWHGYRPDKLNALGRLHTTVEDISELDAAAMKYLADEGVPA